MAAVSWHYVVVVLRVASKEREVQGPSRDTEAQAQADLEQFREQRAAGDWIDLPWISVDAKSVVAVYLDSGAFGVF